MCNLNWDLKYLESESFRTYDTYFCKKIPESRNLILIILENFILGSDIHQEKLLFSSLERTGKQFFVLRIIKKLSLSDWQRCSDVSACLLNIFEVEIYKIFKFRVKTGCEVGKNVFYSEKRTLGYLHSHLGGGAKTTREGLRPLLC